MAGAESVVGRTDRDALLRVGMAAAFLPPHPAFNYALRLRVNRDALRRR